MAVRIYRLVPNADWHVVEIDGKLFRLTGLDQAVSSQQLKFHLEDIKPDPRLVDHGIPPTGAFPEITSIRGNDDYTEYTVQIEDDQEFFLTPEEVKTILSA